ncbi:hypothetical protein UPYG_G00170460 [Umbra pygmaea]|uniref:EF-hand and coiled-coil domain-containing protein 1-like n=1 Tax=Umbra pygmaea TaxID=75934 RepID=A0ABD0WNK0_UMBPY
MKSSLGTVMKPSLSSPRPARKSEWLRSALAHYHSPDPGVENEILVLATGIDQYLQEVFHHLVYPNQGEMVSAEDFKVLCSILGLTGKDMETRDAEIEGHELFSRLPRELAFRDFHSRLCGYFRVRARDGTGLGLMRLPATEETEHIEREIRLRWPRIRRRKCVSFDLTRDLPGSKSIPKARNHLAKLHHETGQTEAECMALRELVEDLRSALQGSDARCLALEVALRRQKSPVGLSIHYSNVANSKTSKTTSSIPSPNTQGQGCAVGEEKVSGRLSSKDHILRELQLIRSSRDGQLEEAIRFNQRLEEELGWAYGEVHRLERVGSRLRRENTEIRWRAEEVRNALREGLQKVCLIQEQAQMVPELQGKVIQLEAELEDYRSRCTCCRSLASAPRGATDDPGLQRAVEGRAASDEEEEERESDERRKEEKVSDDGQCCLQEVKRLINRLHNCGRGCQHTTAHHLLSQSLLHDNQNHLHGSDLHLVSRGWGHWAHTNKEVRELEKEVERLKLEVQMVETERVRLSLLEEKLTDTLTLLQQLRIKGVSRRALGNMLIDTLDVCGRRGHGPSHVMHVANTLCAQLSSCELLRDKGGEGGEGSGGRGQGPGAVPTNQRTTGTLNPLLISC